MRLRRMLLGWTDRGSRAECVPVRATTRLPLAIDVTLSGKDEDGDTFKETTRTIDIGKNAARIATFHQLAPGAEVSIENCALGRTAVAKVAWRSDRRSPKEPIEIAVELLETFEPESIWGIKSPPEDWEEGSPKPTLAQRLEYLGARDRAGLAEFLPKAEAEAAEPVLSLAAQPNGHALQKELETTSSTEQGRIQAEVPAPLDVQIEGHPSTDFTIRQTQATQQAKQEIDRVLQTITAEAKEKLRMMAGAMVPSLHAETQKVLEKSAAQIASQLAQTLEEQARAACRSADAAVDSISLAAEEALAKLQTARQKMEASFAKDYQKRLAELSTSAIEGLQPKSDALLEGFQDQLQNTLHSFQQKGAKEVADQVQKMAEDLLERSAKQLQKRADDTLEMLSEERKAWGIRLVGETKKQLAGMAQASLESLAKQTKATAEECCKGAAQTLREQARTACRSADAAVNSINLAAEEALAKLQTARQKMEASFGTNAEDRLKQSAESLAPTIEGLQRESDAVLEGFQGQLQNTLHSFQQKGAKEVTDQLQKMAEDLLERSAKQLQKRADDTLEMLSEERKAWGIRLVGETKKQLAGMAQASLESLAKQTKATAEECCKEAAQTLREQARTACRSADAAVDSINLAAEEALAKLQTARQKMEASFAKDYQKQLAELSTSAIEGLHPKSDALLEGFQDQLQNTLHGFQQKGAKEVADQLQKMAEGLLERSAKQLQKRADDTLEMLSEERKTWGIKLVDETKKQLAGMTQASLESVTKQTRAAAEECRNQLRQMVRDFVARSAREIEAERGEWQEKQRKAKEIDDFSKASLVKLRGEFSRLKHGPMRRAAGVMAGLCLVAIAPTLLVIYLSTRSAMRLRADPPAEFLAARQGSGAKLRPTEERLARAYWECASRYVQPKYPFRTKLPVESPVEFQIKGTKFPAGLEADLAKNRYWQKLREVWVLPEAWEESSESDTDWIHSVLGSTDWIHSILGNVRIYLARLQASLLEKWR